MLAKLRPAALALLIVSTAFLAFGSAAAQQTNVQALENLAGELAVRAEALRGLRYQELSARTSGPQGVLNLDPGIELIGVAPNGRPLFYATENLNAARTLSTDDVWIGGSSGHDLDGANQWGELAIWDGGGVRTSHQEYGGRVMVVDGTSGTHYHATHVAGTMVGAGVDPAAKGMSHAAYLESYNWTNDESEMASAAAGGLLVSNHSYGWVAGWRWSDPDWYWYGDVDVDTAEDAGFGYYGSNSEIWDQIAHDAPDYLIFKSAGNDRNDAGPGPGGGHYYWNPSIGDWDWSTDTRNGDGDPYGYDTLPYYANAKNIMTMGAVTDLPGGYSQPGDVVSSSFSGWGPTDDGRIKPDLVANGVGLWSTLDGSDTDYASYSGTSMSTPNASGSAHLIVQQYKALYGGSPMRAATLKALLIHTADEAGDAPGPDYSFGWGLMNTRAAADLVADGVANSYRIQQADLANGEADTLVFYSNGDEPLWVTVAWTDRPGNSPIWSLDPTDPMLVHDLDLRVEEVATGTPHLPYVMNPASPADAATTGDNDLDNVEQVRIETPSAGDYRIIVTHEGFITGTQHYSLINSGLSAVPTIADFSADPAGGCGPLLVQFTDESIGTVDTWYWDFGDGATSTLQNPTHLYEDLGSFDVSLQVSGPQGSDAVLKAGVVAVGLPVVDFSAEPVSGLVPLTVQFADLSERNPHAWQWFFGDGENSIEQNPEHTYALPGTYTVNLIATNECGQMVDSKIDFIAVAAPPPPVANFGADPVSGCVPLSVAFSDSSTGDIQTWAWDFGDGATDSVPDPMHDFTAAGLYTVSLTVTGLGGFDTLVMTDLIAVGERPEAGFTASTTAGEAPLTVVFTDTSIGIIDAWSWDFGDGATDTVPSPTHTYLAGGSYTVTLVVANTCGTDTLRWGEPIIVTDPPQLWVDVTAGPLGDGGDSIGASWPDFDGDGRLDVYFTNTAESPSLLLRNDGAAVFSDLTAGDLLFTGHSHGTAWADYDNDGDLDVYVANDGGANFLLRNDGAGVFTDATSGPLGDAGQSRCFAWGDYDRDGWVDIYLVNRDEPNVLMRNMGDGTFTDVTTPPLDDMGAGHGVAWVDYDLDGEIDLYISNNGGPNVLVRNHGSGFFTDETPIVLQDPGPSTGMTWADYDDDGDADLYLAMGGEGNLLIRNDGAGAFTDVTSGALADSSFGLGVAWFDADNDGLLDLYVANNDAPNILLRQDGGAFVDATTTALADTNGGHGFSAGDMDDDGDLDLYLANGAGNRLLRNDSTEGNHWLHLTLEGTVSNRAAIGARAQLHAGGQVQTRAVSGGEGYCSQPSLDLEFGLGAATAVDSVVVFWPSGVVMTLQPGAVDTVMHVIEDNPLSAVDPLPTRPADLVLHPCVPNPFNPQTTIAFDLPRASRVSLRIYDLGGRLVRTLINGEMLEFGRQEVVWNGRDTSGAIAAAGVYFYRIDAEGQIATRRMTLVK